MPIPRGARARSWSPRALRGSRERRAVLKSFLMYRRSAMAVARYLGSRTSGKRDHDLALRKAVSGMRTALLKASAGSALIRINTGDRDSPRRGAPGRP